METVITILEKLNSYGIGLFIDDFGTGYSSLTYLRQIPFNLLKIDRSFIQNINESKQDMIVSTIILMAHKLGMKVVAEGVETDEQRSYLIQQGCNFMQGYYFSKPLAADEIEAKLPTMLKNEKFLSKEAY